MQQQSSLRKALAFAAEQSYGKRVEQGESALTPVGPVYDGTRLSLPRGLLDSLQGHSFPPNHPIPREDAAPVLSTLYVAFGVSRFEPNNAYPLHRSFPSARSSLAASAFLVEKAAGPLSYDPIHHQLTMLKQMPRLSDKLSDLELEKVVVVANPRSIPSNYGALRYALAVLEAGHALYMSALLLQAQGVAFRTKFAFNDLALLANLALDPDDGWVPVATIDLLGNGYFSSSPNQSGLPKSCLGEIAEIERASYLQQDAIAVWRDLRPLKLTHSQQDFEAVACDTGISDPSLLEVLRRRTSGRGVSGLAAKFKTLQLSTLLATLSRSSLRTQCDLQANIGDLCNVRIFFAVQRCEDYDDGIYEYRADSGVRCLRLGNYAEEVQEAFTYPASDINLRAANLTAFMVVDYPNILSHFGPRGFRLVSGELGWLAQSLCLSAAANGLFARPCRSFHEYKLDSLLELNVTETVAYKIICGFDKFRDINLDLAI